MMVHWDEFKSHGQEERGDDEAGHGCHGHGLSFIGLLSFVYLIIRCDSWCICCFSLIPPLLFFSPVP